MTLACSALRCGYGREPVLLDISFLVENGTFCAILGRNGSGKTTLLHCLGGILKPDQGRLELDGLNIARLSRQELARLVSLVPQESIDIFPFQVIDVVVMGRTPFLSLGQSPGRDDYRLAWQTLGLLEAGYLGERNFNKISGGERQIALLARALVQSANTILLDEPTNHLDFQNTYRLLGRIKELCRSRGLRAMAAIHDPNLAYLFSDQVVMLKEGRLLAQGPTEQIMTAERVSELYGTETLLAEVSRGLSLFFPALIKRYRS